LYGINVTRIEIVIHTYAFYWLSEDEPRASSMGILGIEANPFWWCVSTFGSYYMIYIVGEKLEEIKMRHV
jgi:hypothetical protein